MNKNDKKNPAIKVYVFIARDDNEYKRYSFVECEEEIRGQDTSTAEVFFRWRYHPKTRVLRFLAHKKAFGGDMGYQILAPSVEGGTLANALYAYASGDVVKEADIIADVETFSTKLTEILNNLTDIQDETIIKNGSSVDCCIFIHWGGVEGQNMLFFEEFVQKKLPSGWQIFSIGTDRNNLFHVDQFTIKIPCLHDIETLLNHFEDAQTFAHLKDILSKLVVNGAKTLSEGEKKLVVAFLSRKVVVNDFRINIGDHQLKWLKKWKPFQDYLAADETTVQSIILTMLQKEEDKFKAFITQLLTVPHLLSEGLLV